MTAAARPTWVPAKGNDERRSSRKYSSMGIAAHTTLKPRKEGQDRKDEVQRRNLRDELEDRERRHFSSKGHTREVEDRVVPRSIDADDAESYDDDEDDEDDEEALLLEHERLGKEKAERKEREEREKQDEELNAREEQLLRGSPLLASSSLKRRWDDDVVFKNQARNETKTCKHFINDTTRSNFHRKFLHKYTNK